MARKGKRRTKTVRRRRSVGGIKFQNKDLMLALGVTGGLLATAFINQKVGEMKDEAGNAKVDPMLVAGLEIAAGLFAPQFIGKGNDLVKGIGMGMAGAGALNLLKDAGVITGMEGMVVNGWTSQNQLMNGLPGSVVNGLPGKVINGGGNELANALNVITGLGDLKYDEYVSQ